MLPESHTEQVRIFDIGTFSKHDGPGVRTVVYFQGCNARCDWCHSPHSQDAVSPLIHNANVCVGCMRCAACRQGVHSFDPVHRIDRRRCVQCGECVEQCPQSSRGIKGGALHLPTEELSVAALFERIAPYVRLAGEEGGVTLCGGEALLQLPAALELLERCRRHGFHTAVESSGLLSVEVYRQAAPWVDLWLLGMRVVTGKAHPRHDRHIEQVVAALHATGAEILPRIPMVPGFFDREDVLGPIVDLLERYAIRRVSLNPWNSHYDVLYTQSGTPLHMNAPTARAVDTCRETLTARFSNLKMEAYEND